MAQNRHCNVCHRRIFDTIGLEQINGNGIREEDCTVCLDPIEPEQETLIHSECKHTWHQSCLESWITANIGPYQDNEDVRCPMCRNVIAQWASRQQIVFLLPTELSLDDTINKLHTGSKVLFVPRYKVHLDANIDHLEIQQFAQEHLLPNTQGQFRSIPTPSDPILGSEVFLGFPYTQGGCLTIQACPHEKLIVLLTAEEVYSRLSTLYALGWSPHSGLIETRINLNLMKGKSLPEILATAGASAVQGISHWELKQLFPDFQPFRLGLELHLRLTNESDDQGRSIVEGLVYEQPTNPTLLTIHSAALKNAFVRELGGVGDNFVLRDIGHVAYVVESLRGFSDISTPFDLGTTAPEIPDVR